MFVFEKNNKTSFIAVKSPLPFASRSRVRFDVHDMLYMHVGRGWQGSKFLKGGTDRKRQQQQQQQPRRSTAVLVVQRDTLIHTLTYVDGARRRGGQRQGNASSTTEPTIQRPGGGGGRYICSTAQCPGNLSSVQRNNEDPSEHASPTLSALGAVGRSVGPYLVVFVAPPQHESNALQGEAVYNLTRKKAGLL